MTPYHPVFLHTTKTLTLVFLLSHHLHAAAATLHGNHRHVQPQQQLAGTTTPLCRAHAGKRSHHWQHPHQHTPAQAPTYIDWARVHGTRTSPCICALRRGRHACTIVFIQHVAGATIHGLHLHLCDNVHDSTMLEREVATLNPSMVAPQWPTVASPSPNHHSRSRTRTWRHFSTTVANPTTPFASTPQPRRQPP